MTTSTVTTPIDHTSTAGFRAWGSEFSAQLTAIGLVQTADTGQIDWTTVTHTTTGNQAQGYEIWRFADSTLYIKFEYGTSSNGDGYPGIWVTVGTGSNGSGTITGTGVTTTRALITVNNGGGSTTTSSPSYFSRTAGHLAILWKTAYAGASTSLGYMVLGKTVDGTGATTTTGYGLILGNNSASFPQICSVRLISPVAVSAFTQYLGSIIGVPTTSIDAAGNYQSYACYVAVPDVLPFMYASGVNINDIPKGASFSVNMVGATAHTYLGMGQTGGFNGATAANWGLAMLYE